MESSGQPFEGTGLPFYRCSVCSSIVSVWDIEKHGGCGKCGQKRVWTTSLSFFEKIVQIIKHPLVWKWKERKEHEA